MNLTYPMKKLNFTLFKIEQLISNINTDARKNTRSALEVFITIKAMLVDCFYVWIFLMIAFLVNRF